MVEAFKAYFAAIKSLDISDATEHTLRGPLENLLKAIAQEENSKIRVIHEPKKDKTGLGAPDFKFKLNEAILGYLENKKISDNLDAILKSAQLTKYKQLSGNIILTNYLEWIWLKDGHIIKRETLCYASDVGFHKARLDPDKAEKTGQLITNFLSTPPAKIAQASRLSLALAVRCHELREFLLEELLRQTKEHQEGRLYGLYQVFKRDVFHELELKEFADAFSQTLGYGLFLAKLNAGDHTPVTLQNAKQYIPGNFELIRELVDFLDELEREEYHGIKWLVEEILSIMNTLNLVAIHEDLAFTKAQGRLFEPTEEERQLFAKDPYIYFYEDFLKAYDKDTRKARGVYYTPPPVVNFIIRAVNDILKDTFGIAQGLADRKRVTVLDFATGTGTFLVEVLQQIFEEVSEGIRDQVIQQHALKNLYGFEYLIAPYTIAHLKLSQFLHDKGYTLRAKERLQIYLTNTLEPIEPQKNFLLPALSREVEAAQEIKEKKILVITGNPPYNVKSKNTGEWITKLLKDAYFKVDGKPLKERNPKNLLDDYVKFIRFAQWKMEGVEEGIVGIITNHSFLDNPTFRGMRQSLMQTFNQIYILDLHGNTKKKETTQEGGKDENVFDIAQGVAISILVKKKGLQWKVSRADLWGKRKEKYVATLSSDIVSLDWQELQPDSPAYLFASQNIELREEYDKGWKISDMFRVQSTGIKTHRDHFVIDFEEAALRKRIETFRDLTIPDDDIASKYALESNRDWNLAERRRSLAADKGYASAFTYLLYRPFDTVPYFHHDDAVDWTRNEVMRHILAGENYAFGIGRQFSVIGADSYDIVTVTDKIIDTNYYRRGGVGVFPLYEYSFSSERKPKTALFDEDDPFQGKDRIENFSQKFRAFVDEQYKHHYSPEDIMGYIYAVLHSLTYRETYLEFLKIDFPRVPFVDDRQTFEALAKLGWELVQTHLLKVIPKEPKVDVSKGDSTVEKPVYQTGTQRLYINKEKYFFPVPPEVWQFHIGGYQVLDKYLKSRKGRTLTLDETENILAVVKVLYFTHQQMQKIHEVWQP